MNLRTRIYLILGVLGIIALVGWGATLFYTYSSQNLFVRIIDEYLASYRAAEEMEKALVNQKGFVTYYFLDGDPEWLRQLGECRQIFRDRLLEAQDLADTQEKKKMVKRIEAEYDHYIEEKDRVINYYKQGDRDTGAKLHKEVRKYFAEVLDLCEEYKEEYLLEIERARGKSFGETQKVRIVTALTIVASVFLVSLLVFVLLRYILGPIRTLAFEAERKAEFKPSTNEVAVLGDRVRGILKNIDETQSELARSRAHLFQTEKMALVGRLASGMAHSIRNPLTSVKMRLFSLSRTLDLTTADEEDFQVIGDEIRHIDTIVRNFLEFSRPPKLTTQRISPSDIVDMTLKLLKHRLESYNVKVELKRDKLLPEIEADPEQLKEALVNLIENACEAMQEQHGGEISIVEKEVNDGIRHEAVIFVIDYGPGISRDVQDKIFQPFFTTKEEGTGLGLPIAARIIEEHEGSLNAFSEEEKGTTFTIALPIIKKGKTA
ncbi:MAG: ATP-binding protein [Pseudomonadota bacterium]